MGKRICEIIKERMIGCDYELSTIVFDTSRWASPRVDEGKAGDARVSGHVDVPDAEQDGRRDQQGRARARRVLDGLRSSLTMMTTSTLHVVWLARMLMAQPTARSQKLNTCMEFNSEYCESLERRTSFRPVLPPM